MEPEIHNNSMQQFKRRMKRPLTEESRSSCNKDTPSKPLLHGAIGERNFLQLQDEGRYLIVQSPIDAGGTMPVKEEQSEANSNPECDEHQVWLGLVIAQRKSARPRDVFLGYDSTVITLFKLGSRRVRVIRRGGVKQVESTLRMSKTVHSLHPSITKFRHRSKDAL